MLRAIAAAFISYIAMASLVVLAIALTWFALGSRFAFEGDTQNASTGWVVIQLIAGLIAAVVGGMIAALVGGRHGSLAIRILIGLFVLLGVVSLITGSQLEPPPLPEGTSVHDLDFFAAGQYAISPTWYRVAIIFVGAVGVSIGGRLRAPRHRQTASTEKK